MNKVLNYKQVKWLHEVVCLSKSISSTEHGIVNIINDSVPLNDYILKYIESIIKNGKYNNDEYSQDMKVIDFAKSWYRQNKQTKIVPNIEFRAKPGYSRYEIDKIINNYKLPILNNDMFVVDHASIL